MSASDNADLPASEGGSAAARAFKAQLAAESASQLMPLAAAVGAAPRAAAGQPEPRIAVRKAISGKARVAVVGGAVLTGKVVDISTSGLGVLMDDPMPPKRVCTLGVELLLNGERTVLSVRAVAVYSVLVSGKGYRIGFQFGTLEPAMAQMVARLAA